MDVPPFVPPSPVRTPGSWRTGLAVGGLVVVALVAMAGVAFLLTSGLREGATGASLRFANEAAQGRAPEGVPANPAALGALREGGPFETSVTASSGQFSNGVACVTISPAGRPSVRTVVVVTEGVGRVVSYGLADTCPCPARLRVTSALACR